MPLATICLKRILLRPIIAVSDAEKKKEMKAKAANNNNVKGKGKGNFIYLNIERGIGKF
jgi:hypothetical protein